MKQKEKLLDCDVTPHISVMKNMASVNGTIPSRIMELVDNSIDARVEGEKLRVDIVIHKDGSCIEVKDNGCGMDETAAKRFFRLGDSDKKNKIGKFGLGAKLAVIGLGDICSIHTCPIGEDFGFDIYFDIHSFSDWKVQYKLVNKKVEHGTHIVINKLSISIGNVDKLADRFIEQLGKVYKHFIDQDEVEIYVNKKLVRTKLIEIDKDTFTDFDFETNGKRVTGWAAKIKDGEDQWKNGFDLFHRGRIIKNNDLLGKPNASISKLVGEIHLDDFDVDVHKTSFMRDKADYIKMQQHMTDFILKDLIKRVEEEEANGGLDKYQKDLVSITKSLTKLTEDKNFLDNIDIRTGIFKKLKEKTDRKTKDVKMKEEKTIETLFEKAFDELEKNEKKEKKQKEPSKGKKGLIIHEPIALNMGENHPLKRWIADETEYGHELVVEINLDHPLFKKEDEWDNVLVYLKNITLDAFAEFVLNEEKKQQTFVVSEIERLNEIKDMVVRYSL